ncbi:(2Fe-2S)-binding protein [Haloplanus rubicundus]|uniref:(2Fe-2S)-binding protein n=1 Tax=Haloplanus rubicundus TaxID=1547898 RepID=A0A345EDT2_9EURY|nr:2Fe-2S iron-sulfur cluster binding domain-containing protein [Haloplanus rubicundus]AXG06986.1 (2Fe-2S)-binding protein [Haloplanus rubicundus]AXG10354.1 (2Fe-2S)-binding protein [Haloplanus rubicundus]
MPTVTFEGERIQCETGARLRNVLLDAGHSPHNGPTALSCHGLGTCGTCAVEIEGAVAEPTARERARLDFPPHTAERGLRLACQVRVTDDLTVTKHDGFWGHRTE